MIRCCIVLSLTVTAMLAQTKDPSDAWLMQNYRFAPAPAPGDIRPVSPTLGQLQEIQNTTLNILHKANYAGDYEAALAAAAQATATAQLMGAITGEVKPPQMQRPAGIEEQPRNDPAGRVYLIAFRDDTIQAATAVWADRLMLHYMTRRGAHEQVRLDQVDWKLSEELNRNRREDTPAQRLSTRLR